MFSNQPAKSSRWSLAYINFKRAVNFGKIYLIISLGASLLISAINLLNPNAASAGPSSALSHISEIPALLLPLFAVTGSYGSLMVFVSDKDKGVYEYLIAYGINPSKIFWSTVLAAIGLESMVLGISICANVAVVLVSEGLTLGYAELLAFYVIPMSYAVAAFMSMAGIIWSSLTVKRSGVNSPVGVIPIIGEAPIIGVLLVSLAIAPSYFLLFVGSVSLILFILVGVMIWLSNSKIVRERFLSNA